MAKWSNSIHVSTRWREDKEIVQLYQIEFVVWISNSYHTSFEKSIWLNKWTWNITCLWMLRKKTTSLAYLKGWSCTGRKLHQIRATVFLSRHLQKGWMLIFQYVENEIQTSPAWATPLCLKRNFFFQILPWTGFEPTTYSRRYSKYHPIHWAMKLVGNLESNSES